MFRLTLNLIVMSVLSTIFHGVGAVAPIVGSVLPGIGTAAGAAIGAGLNVVGSAMDANNSDVKSQQLWKQQNAYNDPSAQSARLIKAGINPQFANGNGVVNAGSATTAPSQEASNNIISKQSQLFETAMNARLAIAQVTKAEADAKVASVNADKIANADTKNTNADTVLKLSQSDNVKLQTEMQDMRNTVYAKFGDKQAIADLENLAAQKALSIANRHVSESQLKVLASDVIVNYAHAHNLNISSEQMGVLTPYIAAGMQLDNVGKVLTNTNKSTENSYQGDYLHTRNSLQRKTYHILDAQGRIINADAGSYWWHNALPLNLAGAASVGSLFK